MTLNFRSRQSSPPLNPILPSAPEPTEQPLWQDDVASQSLHDSARSAIATLEESLYLTLDETGTILALNCAGVGSLGYDASALVGQSVAMLLHAKDWRRVRSRLHQAASGHTSQCTVRFVHHNKTVLCGAVTIHPLHTGKEPSTLLMVASQVSAADIPSEDDTPNPATSTLDDSHREPWNTIYRTLFQHFPNGAVVVFDPNLRYLLAEGVGLEEAGLTSPTLIGKALTEVFPAETCAQLQPLCQSAIDGVEVGCELAFQNRLYIVHGIPVRDQGGAIIAGMAIAQDITDRKQVEETLRQQTEAERLRSIISHLSSQFARHIRQSLDLKQILDTTVVKILQILQADRVLVYRTYQDGDGNVLTESLAGCSTVLNQPLPEDIFPIQCYDLYSRGHIRAINDIENDNLPDCLVETMRMLGIRAKLVVPILQQDELWGLLIAHQCSDSRQWQSWEIELMSQLASQVEIAIYQSELYNQVQRLNANLERQIQVRTAQLQLAFEFEATLKRITDKVRDSLDEDQILQAAVQELATVLGVSCCNAALYDLERDSSTIRYEYTTTVSPSQGRVAQLSAFPEIYGQLLQGLCFQFCSITPNPLRGHVAMLSAPIFDDQGVLGDLWLINHKYYAFTEQDIRLVQQVANQCAIALRQARLYQASQAQVKELERLNRLKDDFLSTVSHELRTPMSNIKMAIQMLEILLRQSGVLDVQTGKAARYFNILHEESQREISLINDLLDLSRLDAGAEPLNLVSLDVRAWVSSLVHPFEERTRSHEQQLQLDLPDKLPAVTVDISKLERILTELLTNACKYTPANETITVSLAIALREDYLGDEAVKGSGQSLSASPLTRYPAVLSLSVVNTGVEIPEGELSRIFEKFYRIPNNDPWQYGGTGLGLALVKKLTDYLQGTIQVTSAQGETRFAVDLPVQLKTKVLPVSRQVPKAR